MTTKTSSESALETSFNKLATEWRRLQEERVSAWDRLFEEMAREERDLIASSQWVSGRADFLGILERHRRETDHSKILAWLMNPRGHHGLGVKFLSAILRKAFVEEFPVDDMLQARTMCEVPGPKSRADIVIRFPGITIVVETKVDAKESKGQCDKLFTDFRDRCGSRFLFLTPWGEM